MRLFHGRLRVIADLNFRDARPPLQGQHRNRLTIDIEIVQRHRVPFQDFYFDDWLGMLAAAQVLVNADGGALPVRHAVDDQPRPENAVPARKNARR